MVDIPIIETERLRLRPFRLEDFSSFAAMWADPQVVRFIGDKQPSTRQQSWGRFLARIGHWPLFGFGSWAIEKQGEFIGSIGIAYFKRDIEPFYDMPELGYVLAAREHGKGYAVEAGRAVLTWSDQNLDIQETVCEIDKDNIASLRVAEKLGYREFRRAMYEEKPVILLSRMRCPPARA